jgi:ferredoxin--NADP+ reductase
VCPVDCIVPGPNDDEWTDFYIDPQACIDCGACVPVCPVDAIYAEADVPDNYEDAKQRNQAFFDEGPGYWDFDLDEQRE